MRHRSDCRGCNRNYCCICICVKLHLLYVFTQTNLKPIFQLSTAKIQNTSMQMQKSAASQAVKFSRPTRHWKLRRHSLTYLMNDIQKLQHMPSCPLFECLMREFHKLQCQLKCSNSVAGWIPTASYRHLDMQSHHNILQSGCLTDQQADFQETSRRHFDKNSV